MNLLWRRPDVDSQPKGKMQHKDVNAEAYPRLGPIRMYAECGCLRCSAVYI